MCESESEVAQSCLILCDPVDYSPPGSSIRGILQARILEWVAISFSRDLIWVYWDSRNPWVIYPKATSISPTFLTIHNSDQM